ncbi:MAG: glycosyltransferase family 2 protein [Candidatus Hodarchaeota archaeon]
MPKISVISIAKKDEDLNNLLEKLKNQTYKDYEIIISTKGTIPEAWNDAISKAKGEFIVLTESDAFPLTNSWLEEISKYAKKNTIIKGLEIRPTDLDCCNLVCDATILKNEKFNENFNVAEDSELFARLRKKGVKIEFINSFPVVHIQKITWKKTISRSFIYGKNYVRIIYMYGKNNLDNVNTMNFKANYIHPVSNRLRIITENILLLLGLFIGAIYYLPILIKNTFFKQ